MPSQLLDTVFLPNTVLADASTDRFAERMAGAFGFPCPYGHEYEPGSELSFNWDIVCGGVSGLCVAKQHIVTEQGGLHSVNLLFDCEDASLSFRSPYTNQGSASILPKRPLTVRLRVPDLLDTEGLVRALAGQNVRHMLTSDWLYLFALPAGKPVALPMRFAQEERRYPFRGKIVTMLWEGERVLAAESCGKRLCYFPSLY